MNSLNYLFVSQVFTTTILSIVFVIAWKTIEPKRHTLYWAILFVVTTLRVVLNGAKNLVELEGAARDGYWIVVNAMSLGVQGLALAGFRERDGRQGWTRPLVISLVAVELGVAFFTVVRFHQGLRMVLIPWSGTVILLMCAWILVRPRTPRSVRAAEWATAVIFVLYGGSQFVAGAAALAQGAARDDRWLELYSRINFIAMPGLMTGLGLLTVLILADDLADRMRTLALTDSLTGVLNRRGFERAAAGVTALSHRQNQPMCLALVDVDHFKSINDTHGHFAGDRTLDTLATTLAAEVREGDIIGRLGGDEFAVILPFTDARTCRDVIERLRRSVESTPVKIGPRTVAITASFGVALVDPALGSISETLKHADRALYSAKARGRNRVAVFGDDGCL